MQPFTAAMLRFRSAVYAAILRSLTRTKSLLQCILDLWISSAPFVKTSTSTDGESDDDQGSLVKFMDGVKKSFIDGVTLASLLALSRGLRREFHESLVDNAQCMLPSFNYQLPTGRESGTYLALDVGGSNFRVALICLSGYQLDGQEAKLLGLSCFPVTRSQKLLKGIAFFDWMADRIHEVLQQQNERLQLSDGPLSVGVSWSFPIQQTSLRSGLLLGMGKGFLAADGLLGQDLGDLIQDSCSRKNLNVKVQAIVNDSSATLLSKAYVDPTTRFALILGTGFNAAVHLPVHMFSPGKFGVRPPSWFDSAKHIIVNTELSMFGGKLLPFTVWDKRLLLTHPRPTFQPFEYFVSGGYLGEITRLVLVDSIENAGLFGAVIPPSLREPHSLDTQTLSLLASKQTFSSAQRFFVSRHPSSYTPTSADIEAIRQIASLVTSRASALIAAGVHALWEMRNEAESVAASESSHTLVAYNGSVLENYPDFKTSCQKHLDALVEASGGEKGVIELIYAEESSLIGAAVAVACLGA